jgi:hypothetical protein
LLDKVADKKKRVSERANAQVSLTLQTLPLPNGVERIWTAADHCGNSAEAIQLVTAQSTTCKKEEL